MDVEHRGRGHPFGVAQRFCPVLRSFQAVTSTYQGCTQISSKFTHSSGMT